MAENSHREILDRTISSQFDLVTQKENFMFVSSKTVKNILDIFQHLGNIIYMRTAKMF